MSRLVTFILLMSILYCVKEFWHFGQIPKIVERDYDGFFNCQDYMDWFKNKFIPNFSTPSLTILDNDKYHK